MHGRACFCGSWQLFERVSMQPDFPEVYVGHSWSIKYANDYLPGKTRRNIANHHQSLNCALNALDSFTVKDRLGQVMK